MEKVKSLLASERVNRQFGLATPPTLASEPKVTEPTPEPEAEFPLPRVEPGNASLDKFVEVEQLQALKDVRNLIQTEVDERMQSLEREQFDIDWDPNDNFDDIAKWIKTLSKFGRNTKQIQKVFNLANAS